MKILLTNDDGIDAGGLATLEKVVSQFGEVVTVAPLHQHSGCGHQVTFHGALTVNQVGANRYSVDGTPADCVRLGIAELVGPVDWVISGINQGSNLGNDVFMSGTVAAAREAAWHDHASIAISQFHLDKAKPNWDWSEKLAKAILPDYLKEAPGPKQFWNINLPMPEVVDLNADVPPVRNCPIDPHSFVVKFKADGNSYHIENGYHDRPRTPKHDVESCFGGNITVTLL